jgi:hypothetical protein
VEKIIFYYTNINKITNLGFIMQRRLFIHLTEEMKNVCGEGAWALPAIQRDLEIGEGRKILEPSTELYEIYSFEFNKKTKTAAVALGFGRPPYQSGVGLEYLCNPDNRTVQFQKMVPGAGFVS